ncbi:type II secretion system minor pseudopilin GspK [uncultured Gilvimarinus sp.]|uniref:type II secretion system minor pseudopilin GspK n=1 Tax=uncultured Gilvimarinus sp. TaxID=1689143 RepID=UPI0030EB5136|tara:strand:+ start:392 stop:1480 length:1089 start_codon:yes stop_codon:yes gene_type:complete
MTWPTKLPQRQRGSVLILAILIVAMVSAFAIKASRDYQLSMARAEARWHGAQARAYLSGAESLAIYFLELDEELEVDSLLEPWAQELPPFPVEGGVILAQIEDASAKLNINDVVAKKINETDGAPNDPTRFSLAQKHFLRLLQSFEEQYPVTEEQAISIVEAMRDWIDTDDDITGYNGAERDYYQSLDPMYLPANAKEFTSVEELRLVRHMTGELMTLLRPFITVLDPEESKLNANTMHPQLLRTFNADNVLAPLTPEQAGQVMQDAGVEYGPENTFADNPAWSSVVSGEGGVNTEMATHTSNYFRVTTRVQLGDQRRSMQSLLQRTDGDIKVIARRDVYDYILDLERAATPTTIGQTTDNE